MTNFIFCIHNHQPVGNFDYVMEHAFKNGYDPFLKRLYEYPSVKLSLHTTGFLLDWLVDNRPAYIELLREMVSRGQVEIMSGGYYEPVLAVIPERDRLGQIIKLTDRVEEVFGVRPRGLWLAERVWDPALPATLHDAGIEYLVVDDNHFIKSGLKTDDLFGYYITEELGRPVKVFPGSERLRYLMPFETVDKFDAFLNGINSQGQGTGQTVKAAIFADDGEKFGIWPGTHKWVYDEGWLDSFLSKLSECTGDGRLRPVTFSEHIDMAEPLGRVYLPTTSYMEMGQWSLPATASKEYGELTEEVRGWDDGERLIKFFQGGTWRNFFSKYPESDWMHKRMLMASHALDVVRGNNCGDGLGEAASHLYKAQTNDAYWHGVFGGLYLPHLRCAVYEHILKAEGLIAKAEDLNGKAILDHEVRISKMDINLDTHEEVIMRTRDLNLFFTPNHGAGLVELDWKPGARNLTNTLSRWYEGYHEKLKAAACAHQEAGNSGGEGTASIHDMVVTKEKGLEKLLVFDSVARTSFRARFVTGRVSLKGLKASELNEQGDFYDACYETRVDDKKVIFERESAVGKTTFSLEKVITALDGGSFNVAYNIKNTGGKEASLKGLKFCVDLNLCLPGCDGPGSFYEFHGLSVSTGLNEQTTSKRSLSSEGEVKGVDGFSVVDEYAGVRVDVATGREACVLMYPIQTVSLSEAGFEKNYQGSCITVVFPVEELLPVDSQGEPLVFNFAVTVKPL